MCVERDPCFSKITPGYCAFYAPNTLPMSLREDNWWSSPPTICLNQIIRSACCFVNTGMYGYVLPGEEFYYWHEAQEIIVY